MHTNTNAMKKTYENKLQCRITMKTDDKDDEPRKQIARKKKYETKTARKKF